MLLLAPAGSLGQGFAPGQSVTVQMHPSSPRMVWAKEGPNGFPDVWCESATQDVRLASMQSEASLFDVYELTVDGERWRGVSTMLGSPAGTYDIVCRGSGATSALSIGDAPWSYDLRHTRFFRMATVGLPLSDTAIATVMMVLGGVVGGLVIAVVVARRRRTLHQSQPAA
ncbi:hypothetical protein [Micromonospora sp. NPDC049679]|uniref:hypothetical protein n=1 Tax=Micromonospora sp. NPDC049679 TaxID=3155920 RepID=UPI0033C533F9